ncbi:MAG: cell division protein FtsQ/DivIB, partial [Xanthomonadales bacterium]|nr:cell division protein FtsQ/DivIB [Xanthomonadales bacterium]
VFTAWRDFNNRLLPTGEEIYRLRLDARGSWFLELQSGTEVHIGRQSARARLDRLVASWPALMNGRALPPRLIDLRYTNGFAVRWPAAKEQYAGTYGEKSR